MSALVSHGTPYVFFYGPLLTGSGDRRLDARLRRILRPYSAAYTQARLYDLGGHPAAVASHQMNERVYGTVFSLRRPDLLQQLDRQTLYRADAHHHSAYLRRLAQVVLLPRHRPFTCWTYFYNGPVAGRPYIRHGDYTAYRAARWGNNRA